jgi:hypothetical protein
MKAFVVDRYGRKKRLRAADMPEPALRDDEVLIQVHAAAVNLLDVKIRNGEFKLILPYRPPFVLGHDVAGVVVRVGPRVRQFKVGDEVYARPDDFRIGTFAEWIAVKARLGGDQAPEHHHGRSRIHPPGGLDGMAGAGGEGQAPGRGRRSSSRRAPAAWARSPSSWPGTWARRWPPPPAPATPPW